MNQIKYYLRSNSDGVGFFNLKDIEKNAQELKKFDDLLELLYKLKTAYETKSDDKAQINICVNPEDAALLGNVVDISAVHIIKKKLFSRDIKENFYSLGIVKKIDNELSFYYYETHGFDEVKQFFYDYIVEQKIPDLSNWKTVELDI